jgi:peptidoglycan/LPS O-acetylase OafA/YrhL
MNAVAARKDAHLPVLDGVRGLAIVGVLLYHFFLNADRTYLGLPPLAKRVFASTILGAKGVDLFFVLSGFLITGILLRSKGSAHYFKNFYIRRSLRIFPLYYLTLIGCLIVGTIAAIPDYQWHSLRWYFFYLHNVRDTFWQPPIGGPGWFWSLAVEEHFYLFWPLVVLLLRRRHLVYFSIFLMLLAPAVRAILVARGMTLFFTLCRMDTLAAGALLAILFSDSIHWQRTVTWTRRLALPIAIPALASNFLFAGSHNEVLDTVKYSLFALACAVIAILALAGGAWNPIPAICKVSWLRAMGKTSYSMYVFHPFVFLPLIGVLYRASWSPLRGMAWLDLVIDFAACFGLTYLISRITWAVIEHPLIKLKDRFQYSAPDNATRRDAVGLHYPAVEGTPVAEDAPS